MPAGTIVVPALKQARDEVVNKHLPRVKMLLGKKNNENFPDIKYKYFREKQNTLRWGPFSA